MQARRRAEGEEAEYVESESAYVESFWLARRRTRRRSENRPGCPCSVAVGQRQSFRGRSASTVRFDGPSTPTAHSRVLETHPAARVGLHFLCPGGWARAHPETRCERVRRGALFSETPHARPSTRARTPTAPGAWRRLILPAPFNRSFAEMDLRWI
ncbi:hypothetical protein M885DRAFT_515948 [Pelagophyceae sp. CCMP2097]|nr:hypothetical protein M885DRAFT_515948 [Pelagophyceae sp. CCMP2097]